MGRKRKTDVSEKRKPVNVRPIERKHSGKVVEPYRIMEELIPEHHPELEGATILLCYRKGWKPDVDRCLCLARMKKASELERALGSTLAENYDFVMQINEDCWPGLDDDRKRMLIDHELCHAAPDLDRDGNQKLDTRERRCWRLRKQPIQEFPEIIERYGAEAALRMNATALDAAEKAATPLFAGLDEEDDDVREGAGNVASLDWREAPIETLRAKTIKVTERHLKRLHESGIDTLGQLAEIMDQEGTWWHKGIAGIGPDSKAPIEDALAAVRGEAS